MSSFLDIRDDEIDVEELMQRIHENITKRKENGKYDEEEISKLNSLSAVYYSGNGELDPQLDLEYILNNWDVRNDTYSITSHRPITGKLLVKGREMVHGEVKRYVEPVNYLQSEFNEHVADFNTAIYQKCSDLESENETLRSELNALKTKFDKMSEMLSDILQNYPDQYLKDDLTNVSGETDKGGGPGNKTNPLSGDKDHADMAKGQDPMNYFLFSEEMGKAWIKGGGPCVNEPNVFEDSKVLFKDSKNVLDIGCGTGTFLKLLKEAGIGGYGIDLNEDYVMLCERLGLDVVRDDAISHLKSLEPKSLDGVFISQLVEHLSSEQLLEILGLCYERMQYESHIVISTPNIRSMLVSTNLFYMDPTHRSHVHPDVLTFMLRSCGFREIRERYYQPVAENIKLRRIEPGEMSSEKRSGNGCEELVDVFNSNTDRLNNLLFGFRDYCVIAKK